jgi:hypothetical protein
VKKWGQGAVRGCFSAPDSGFSCFLSSGKRLDLNGAEVMNYLRQAPLIKLQVLLIRAILRAYAECFQFVIKLFIFRSQQVSIRVASLWAQQTSSFLGALKGRNSEVGQ